MFTNPFHDLSGFLTPAVMQTYVVLMFLAVVGGTIIDVIHKKSAQYFFENAQTVLLRKRSESPEICETYRYWR
jgi:hypothetical protein